MDIINQKIDISSLSNIENITHNEIFLDLVIDFTKKIIYGKVTLSFISHQNNVEFIILDTKSLDIKNVYNNIGNQPLKFELLNEKPEDYPLGIPMKIYPPYPLAVDEKFTAIIEFSTINSAATQWLSKEQTLSKDYPFVYTQCEAIHCRTLFPCQDSPAVKSVVHAKIKVEKPLKVLFGGLFIKMTEEENYNIFEYHQPIPIPTYLIAIAAGDIHEARVSERCRIFGEKEYVEKGRKEFEDVEEFLKAGENYLTPYEWKEYNILILSPGFPYGGMENPCLTFVTPTLLAGDKSLVGTIIHEICHSWTGNLVTNRNWQNFWLNEGFTKFCEKKLIGILFGHDNFLVESYTGYKSLCKTIESMGSNHSFTSLYPQLQDVIIYLIKIDPDDAFSIVPYEKGCLFLFFLEQLIGEINFQKILQNYIKKFRLTSITYIDFKEFFESEVKNLFDQEKSEKILTKIDWEKWIKHAGIPSETFDFDNKLIDQAVSLSRRIQEEKFEDSDFEMFNSWTTNVKLVFLQDLEKSSLTQKVYERLRDNFHLHSGYNSEISSIWYQIAMKNGYSDVIPHVKKFLSSIGRMKYLRPVFRGFYVISREEALKTFEEYRCGYHPVAARLVEADFKKIN